MHPPLDRRPWIARASAALSLATLLALALAAPTRAAEPTGIWKLVVLAYGPEDFAIVDLHRDGGAARGVLLDGRARMFDTAKLSDVVLEDGRAEFTLQGASAALSFSGEQATSGPYNGQVVGVIRIQGSVFPAKLEKTRAEKLPPPRTNTITLEFSKARSEDDPKARVKRLRAFAADHAGEPVCHLAYTEILGDAESAGFSAAEVDALIANWRSEARPFGDAWAREAALKSFLAISPQKPYAESALKLGKELEAGLPADAPTEVRAAIAGRLVVAAKNAGKSDAVADAESRLAQFESKLDEEYHAKVPPFKPTPYEGRKKPNAGLTAVMELFTGAQCPPCVAVDVAFDALLQSYKADEFIGLQYHLHIPGPDPLTNEDSLARQEYYGDQIGGTPSVFFNGKADRSGGGSMAGAQDKYNGYRRIVDQVLEKPRMAEVAVTASRQGDEISILAEASAPAPKPAAEKKAGSKAASSVKLRLALTEASIRYVGGNRLRFHHHVVRALPGGVEGTALVDGKGKVEIKVNLAELRERLEAYLKESAEDRPFPGPFPEIAFKNLNVVAFVQDDLDRAILGAVAVSVDESAP